jgi:hypothetical protein
LAQHISRTERVIIVAAVKMVACTNQTRGAVIRNTMMSFNINSNEFMLIA